MMNVLCTDGANTTLTNLATLDELDFAVLL